MRSTKLTQTAVEKAAVAADVGQEYAKFALKYIAAEVRRPSALSETGADAVHPQAPRDAGLITSSKTMMDAMRTVKERFPLLQDLDAAYKTGRKASKEERPARGPAYKTRTTQQHQDDARPQDISTASKLSNDKHLHTDEAVYDGKTVDSAQQHNESQETPLQDCSDDECDGDIDIDEQQDGFYAELSSKLHLHKATIDHEDEKNAVNPDDEDEQALEAERENNKYDDHEQEGPYQLADIEVEPDYGEYFGQGMKE